jgi:septal ring factor EnvC (AmiA/AmiB activator)
MRVWAWIAIGVAVAALAFLVSPLVQIQTELRLANEQVVQARAGIAELERVVANLKTELDAANQARTQLQSGLDEANAEIKKGQSEIERLSTELENATNLAKDAEAPVQGSAAEPSDGWQPR